MRLIIAMLLAALLLAGCGAKTEESLKPPVQEVEPQGFYIPDSEVEKNTGGAVRMYQHQPGHILMQTSGKLILISPGEPIELTALTEENLLPDVKQTLEKGVSLSSIRAIHNGVAYYLPEINEAVILDSRLQEINRVQLPGSVQGTPIFSDDGTQIYFSMGQNVYAFDVAMEISRLIRTHSSTSQSLTGCYLGGSVLSCAITDENGEESAVYFSSQTGEALSYDSSIENLYSSAELFLAIRKDGTVRQLICGAADTTPQNLVLDQKLLVAPAVELGGAVTYSQSEEALQLRFFDLKLGAETAAVALPGVHTPTQFLADPSTGCFWFVAIDSASNQEFLLRWDLTKSKTEQQNSCFAPVYSEESPDKNGLKLSQKRVDGLNNTHGVIIRINDKAISNPGSYTLEREYQTIAIDDCLDQLEAVMGKFPKNFLYKSVQTRIRICIVRDIVDGNGESLDSVRYWYAGNAYIVVTPRADIQQEFIKAMGYIVDSKVLGNSPMYDYWDALNPTGFTYGSVSKELLEGDNRAFADESSMLTATEDRSRLFFQAMQPENEQMFQSEVMQKKLKLLCQAIRDAYGLEKKTDVYPWEQYLNESIAYKK